MPRIIHLASEPKPGDRRVTIGVPTYGPISWLTFATSVDIAGLFGRCGIALDWLIMAGNCHVDDARNEIVRAFRQHNVGAEVPSERLLQIDADVGTAAINALKTVLFEEDVVAGIYPHKQDEESYPVQASGQLITDARGLLPVLGVPAGWLSVSRQAIEHLCARHAHTAHHHREDPPDSLPLIILFERTIVDGERKSGDYEFSRKWIEAGGRIMIDPAMEFSHLGEKVWSGAVGPFWRKKHGVDRAEVANAINALREGGATRETFLALCKAFGNQPFALDHVVLEEVYHLARRGPVLDLGSGLSTLVSAVKQERLAAASGEPAHEVWTLESDPDWVGTMRGFLDDSGIKNVRLLLAPVRSHDGGAKWYAPEGLKPIAPFRTVIVDGPRRDEPGIRGNLLDVIAPLIDRDARWIVDDTDDPDGKAVLARISAATGLEFRTIAGPRREFAVSKYDIPVAGVA